MHSIFLACKAVHAAQQGQPLTEAEIQSGACKIALRAWAGNMELLVNFLAVSHVWV